MNTDRKDILRFLATLGRRRLPARAIAEGAGICLADMKVHLAGLETVGFVVRCRGWALTQCGMNDPVVQMELMP